MAMTPSPAPGGAGLNAKREFSSFRDPSGFLFWQDDQIYRFVDRRYAAEFEYAETSQLLTSAVREGLLLPFEVVGDAERRAMPSPEHCHAVLKPKQVPMITYPYEWCFGQLKDAALVTLRLHLLALQRGALLKDASAFNIQFVDGNPIFIDHLSFDRAAEHRAWPAYGQFCRHFLSPLLLMAYVDLSFNRLSQLYIDGPPLDLVSRLLPWRTRLSPSIQMHLHMHARASRKHSGNPAKLPSAGGLSLKQFQAIASSLLRLTESLTPVRQDTEWGEYYADTNYSDAAFAAKKQMVRAYAQIASPAVVWDLGGNNGEFSHAIRDLAPLIVCMDIDPRAVEQNYRLCRRDKVANILPLVADLTNPTPAVGFANGERRALTERGRPDLAIALALIHHLAISNNLPLGYVARFLASVAPMLIIEFVPKSDSQVRRLLASRPDIFADYHRDGFVAAFTAHFEIVKEEPIPGTERTLYFMRRRPA